MRLGSVEPERQAVDLEKLIARTDKVDRACKAAAAASMKTLVEHLLSGKTGDRCQRNIARERFAFLIFESSITAHSFQELKGWC